MAADPLATALKYLEEAEDYLSEPSGQALESHPATTYAGSKANIGLGYALVALVAKLDEVIDAVNRTR